MSLRGKSANATIIQSAHASTVSTAVHTLAPKLGAAGFLHSEGLNARPRAFLDRDWPELTPLAAALDDFFAAALCLAPPRFDEPISNPTVSASGHAVPSSLSTPQDPLP